MAGAIRSTGVRTVSDVLALTRGSSGAFFDWICAAEPPSRSRGCPAANGAVSGEIARSNRAHAHHHCARVRLADITTIVITSGVARGWTRSDVVGHDVAVITAAWYLATLLTVGAAASARIVSHAPRWPTRVRRAALAASVALLGLQFVRLWSQTRDAFGADAPLVWAQVRIILAETPWGAGWHWQAGASLLCLLVVVLWQSRWPLWVGAAVAASAAAFTTALTGHAVGMGEGVWQTVLAHGTHVVAAGWWIGTLVVLQVVTMDADIGRDVQARLALGHAIERFSPTAIVAVCILVGAGMVATWHHVIGPVGFGGFASPYGLTLLTKIGAFAGAGLCGLYNWRVIRHRVAESEEAARQLRAMIWLEIALGVMAVVLTAVLGTMEMPEPPGGGH